MDGPLMRWNVFSLKDIFHCFEQKNNINNNNKTVINDVDNDYNVCKRKLLFLKSICSVLFMSIIEICLNLC